MRRYEKYSKEVLEQAIKISYCVSDVVRAINGEVTPSSHRHISQRIKYYELDTSHFIVGGKNVFGTRTRILSPESIFVKNKRVQAKYLRNALIESGVKEICALCRQRPFHNGKFLRLQIDHINGNGRDNKKDNLRFLCPNCHSQTDTYGVKNKNYAPVV